MNKVKLNEQQFKDLIKESVNQILAELDWKTYANAAKKSYERGDSKRTKKFRDKAVNAFNGEYGYEGKTSNLKAMPLCDDDFETWRVHDSEGNPSARITDDNPHMSLHYSYNDGKGYEGYGKTSSDIEHDGERTISGDYDANDPDFNGWGMRSAPTANFPLGAFQGFEPGKKGFKNDMPFKEFDDYRKGKSKYVKGKGWE